MYSTAYLLPQVSTKGLLAHWKMWDGLASANKVFDYSLNGNLGTTTMITYGSYPGHLFVNGSQINVGSDTTLDNLFDGGGSFSGWLNPTGKGQDNYGRLLYKTKMLLYCHNNIAELRFVQSTAGTDGVWSFPFNMVSAIWHHVVLTYDSDTAAAGGGPTVYVNGESVVVTEIAAPDDVYTSDAASTMYIGQKSAGGSSWSGKIDDVMFFNRILPATEVKSIFSVTRERYGV
ncbi:hypothetical protein LCGC14_2772190 [marine sediment metagenome]|uniref:LamG-like jellyroll fold domain-containing protein n=1 Tax=marine sediment metagenome TaxID=412755 RepID=A0A0F8YVV9_9ZZZZ